MKNFCKELPVKYGIFGNGNQIINLQTSEEIFRKTIDYSDIEYCLSLARKNKLHVHIYTENEIITPRLLYMDLRNFMLKDNPLYHSNLNFKMISNVEEYILKEKPDVFKLVISDDSSDMSALEEQIKNRSGVTVYRIKKYDKYKDKVINKEYEYLDITPNGTSKNEALNILANYLKISKSEVMAIGDNLNDIDMIKNSGIGVAVSNAYEEVKKVATYTTNNNVDNSGFAEAVYKYIGF